jgi:hypothetical protein
MRNWTDSFWDDLLEYIEERRVIPIIGPEVLRMTVGDQPAYRRPKNCFASSAATR